MKKVDWGYLLMCLLIFVIGYTIGRMLVLSL